MQNLKEGIKLRSLVTRGNGENRQLNKGEVYIFDDYCACGCGMYQIKMPDGMTLLEEADNFELAKPSNAERMKKRTAELNA